MRLVSEHEKLSRQYVLLLLEGSLKNLPLENPLPISTTSKPMFSKFHLSVNSSRHSIRNDGLPLPFLPKVEVLNVNGINNCFSKMPEKGRVFLLDVNPICYNGSSPSLLSFAQWTSLFFSQVSCNDPVIAVLDGERGNEHRRKLLPSYKTNRRKLLQLYPTGKRSPRGSFERSRELVSDALEKCNVPVLRIEGYEADDVIATLVENVLLKGYRAVIASPDKDFKQLISKDIQIVIPIPELGRWSFYTLKHYIAQYNCDPQFDLSLRCMLGDEIDGVPGIQNLAPGFGRKTALKLLRKHGSLEKLLDAVRVRSVGRNYVQEALIKYGDILLRNYEVLSLKRDVDVQIDDQWLTRRDEANDSVTLSNFVARLRKDQDSR